MDINELSSKIIGAAIEVHKALGPGLLESAYEECLCHEFGLRGLSNDWIAGIDWTQLLKMQSYLN
jgi:GxxExxY protein